ncbi:hypothetical protein DL764_000727 [Monosporascus ibericus]|uniref:Dicer-like protein 1 n=1 Tax=Monosporascus ibericus TaxID=155417 RepID=A0A4Q4TS48_9PEZI|nr:hypothetical protein DL764_000727 [Monosporascus ibericus]
MSIQSSEVALLRSPKNQLAAVADLSPSSGTTKRSAMTGDNIDYGSEELTASSRHIESKDGKIEVIPEDGDVDSTSEDSASAPGLNDQSHQQKQINDSASAQTQSDECKSTALLVKEAESEKIINSPREYQVELFEKAKEKNIIAVLDTGTGKTLIAALLLRYTIEQELEDRKAGRPPRLSFFLVDRVSLVFQQYEVFKCNLDCRIARFCGDSISSSDNMEFWKQQTEENMVIVCTADVLLSCLHRSYVAMAQINLLVFDEAHHTKKNHPYARIIKDFYAAREQEGLRRPRILGMTASPIDSKTRKAFNIEVAAAQLEALLHSEITTVNYTDFKSVTNPPEDTIIKFSAGGSSAETLLWQKLSHLVGHHPIFRKLLLYAKSCTKELGCWCADRIWQICLTEQAVQKIEAKMEKGFVDGNTTSSISDLDAERAAVREAYHTILNHPLIQVQKATHHLSHKVSTLADLLEEYFNPETDKCVVFVEQRWTALLLLGGGNGDIGEAPMSLRDQVVTMSRFRQGQLNCLFATSIAEEGLDIPDCNIVIRFDLCKTLIQYIQSRGRARHANSKYFHLVKNSSREHEQTLLEHQQDELYLRQFCQMMPEDRIITGNDFDLDYFLCNEIHPTYENPKTGAKLTYRSSLLVLADFVSSLPHPLDVTYTTDYTVIKSGKGYICEVLLPATSPVTNATGQVAASKQVAKCSAAYEMCIKLIHGEFLDEHLRSVFAKRLPGMRNAHLALSSKKQAEYVMRTKPNIWIRRGMATSLFLTVLRLNEPNSLERPSRPLAILTREPLPNVAKFPLFFGNKRTSEVECIPLSSVMNTSPDEVDALNAFTLRVFNDVFSKEYKSEPEKMPYFLAPLLRTHEFEFTKGGITPRELIDWICISSVQGATDGIEWQGQPNHILKNKFVTDPHDGSRKFFTTGRCGDWKPTDPQLPTAPKGQVNRKATREAPKDIWNYSVSLWSKSRAKIPVRHDLPVIEVEFIPLRRNLLDEFEKVENVNLKCYIVLETMKLSPLPVDVVAMAYNLPAIIFRLESNLIVLDACQSLGLRDIRPDLALEAMTKDSDNTEDHSEEQINFQSGMGKNYERLEFLGDCFLKMGTTIALFSRLPESDEFFYHVDRMVMICNKNLFNNALELKLEESIRSTAFNRRIWYPEGLELLKGKQNTRIKGKKGLSQVHKLADKTIADVCEALIGAAYLTTYEQKSFDLAVLAVTKLVNHENHRMMKYEDYYTAYKTPAWQTDAATAVQEELARQIEEKLGYKFNHPRLLRSAFMHPSYGTLWERIPNYQRLEFLGDALLDMVCVDFLFHRFPDADPQWLTEHKMAMVSNQFLGCLCVSLDLQRHMVCMSGAIQKEIADYVAAITAARVEAEAEAEAADRPRTAYARNFWVEVQKPPKCLPDIVESYVGALFVDSGFDYAVVQRFFDAHARPYFEDMRLYDTFASKHPVTYLTHALQLRFGCGAWRLMVDEAPPTAAEVGIGPTSAKQNVICGVLIHGRVREHAVAASGRYAKAAAAKRLLARLEDMAVEDYRREFACDCNPDEVLVTGAANSLAHATAV